MNQCGRKITFILISMIYIFLDFCPDAFVILHQISSACLRADVFQQTFEFLYPRQERSLKKNASPAAW